MPSTLPANMTELHRQLLTISNEIAEYPPLNLTKSEYQVLLILSSYINSEEKPIYGIDDIKDLVEAEGISKKEDQMEFVRQLMLQQDTYEIPLEHFFKFYEDRRDLDRKMRQYILDAVQSLDRRKIETSHPGTYASITWFDAIKVDTIAGKITLVLGRLSKRVLMGLNQDFLQMMAESTVTFSGNNSIPIFLYMKSQLHKGNDQFHRTEKLEDFQARFGHDTVKTYQRFYDYYRRVLKVAEDDSETSGDIRFRFTGKSLGKGKKVTHIYYHIERTGNIYIGGGASGEKKEAGSSKAAERKAQIAKLTLPQLTAFEFLKSKSVNFGFVLDEVFTNAAMRKEVLQGYEDVFMRLLWNRFMQRTKAQKKAGAFVSWWRNGRLTDGEHYWACVDALVDRKHKQMDADEQNARRDQSKMPHAEYQQMLIDRTQAQEGRGVGDAIVEADEAPSSPPAVAPAPASMAKRSRGGLQPLGDFVQQFRARPAVPFDYAAFQKQFPQQYERILAEITEQMKDFGKKLDEEKLQQMIANSTEQHCEKWYNEEGHLQAENAD